MLLPGYKCIFFHIPRTGGTSISNALITSQEFPIVHYTQRYVKHWTPQQVYQNAKFDPEWSKYFKFTFVRNPLDRLVSEYFWRKAFDRRDGTHIYKTFDSFLSVVAESVKTSNFHRTYVHFRPQHEFVYHEGVNQLDFVGRFEKIEDDFQTVMKHLQINCRLEKLNSSDRVADYEYYYSRKMRELAYGLYEQDFKLFGYAQSAQ